MLNFVLVRVRVCEMFTMEIGEVQPSQLYISQKKLDLVQKHFGKGNQSELEPIPVKRLDDDIVATDGHTRGLAWFLNGHLDLPLIWEDEELDWEAYRICVQWCKDEGISSMADLKTRIVPHDEYEEIWLDRCRVMQGELAEKRSERKQPE
ncbi:MAG: hypothetical protein R6V83_02490 [Candidatus Thorarchaeota archaeon]